MSRPTTSEVPAIDVRATLRAARGGRGGPRSSRVHRPPSLGPWTARGFPGWRMPGANWAVLRLDLCGASGAMLVRVNDGSSDHVAGVELEGEHMRFGGARWWARCPGCGRRCGVVYFAGGVVRCRRCFGLAYPCQRWPAHRRSGAMLAKLGDRLGASSLLDEPERPARMRRATFGRLLARWRDLAARELAALPLAIRRHL